MLVELAGGHNVSIHLIETRIPPYEIRLNLQDNGIAEIHTLFIVWGAMFLPDDGKLFRPDPWMLALVMLYGGKLYAFDVYGKDIRIFPTFFDPAGVSGCSGSGSSKSMPRSSSSGSLPCVALNRRFQSLRS